MTTSSAPRRNSPAAREARVLLVDDDRELCQMLTEYLEAEHFEVSSVHDGGDALAALKASEFELLMLDVMLPTLSGFDVLRKVGASYPTPILMLTARGDDVDRIVGLELGADDYIEQAVQSPRAGGAHAGHTARAPITGAAAGRPTNRRWGASCSTPEPTRCTCAAPPCALTGAEFRVLEMLMRAAGQVISREAMTEQALGRKLVPFDRSIDTHISNLRRKLDLQMGLEPRDQERARLGLHAHPGGPRPLNTAPKLMHSLFVRIFVLFWIAMALIVGGSIAVTFTVAAREYDSPELRARLQRRDTGFRGARQGRHRRAEGLAQGQQAGDTPTGTSSSSAPTAGTFSAGACPTSPRRRLELAAHESMGGPDRQPRPDRPPPGNFRPPHFAPQIVGPDGSTYTVLLVPRRPSIFGALSLPGISLAILVHRAGRERARELVARPALERPHPPDSGGRARAGRRKARHAGGPGARERGSRGPQGRAGGAGARFRRHGGPAARQPRRHTQLLRDISHELRSPLARMRVALGLARQPAGRSERQLERLEREIERLDGLIGQVLKLARLHGTDAPFERESVRSRRGHRAGRARCQLRGRRQGLPRRAVRVRAQHAAAATASCCRAPSRTCCAMRCVIVRGMRAVEVAVARGRRRPAPPD